METLIASAIGILTAGGVYLLLRLRVFPVVLGLSLLSYAVNLFLFASGRLAVGAAPILAEGAARYTDPLPQALVLTAIVISFGMTAVLVMIALGAFLEAGDDRIDMREVEPEIDAPDIRGLTFDMSPDPGHPDGLPARDPLPQTPEARP